MTHSLGFASVSEKLFLIRQLAAASRDYCKTEELGRKVGRYGEDAWHDYSFKLKQLICGYSIECAIKARMLQDSLAGVATLDFAEADAYAREEAEIGKVHVGAFALTVRESCNKIIHATNVELGWTEIRLRGPSRRIEYWDGLCHLRGKQGKSPWHVELDMQQWAVCLEFFIDFLARHATDDMDLE